MLSEYCVLFLTVGGVLQELVLQGQVPLAPLWSPQEGSRCRLQGQQLPRERPSQEERVERPVWGPCTR